MTIRCVGCVWWDNGHCGIVYSPNYIPFIFVSRRLLKYSLDFCVCQTSYIVVKTNEKKTNWWQIKWHFFGWKPKATLKEHRNAFGIFQLSKIVSIWCILQTGNGCGNDRNLWHSKKSHKVFIFHFNEKATIIHVPECVQLWNGNAIYLFGWFERIK